MQTTPEPDPSSDIDLAALTPERLVKLYDTLMKPQRNPFTRLKMVLAVREEAARRGLLEELDSRPRVDPDAASRREWIRAGRPGRGFAQFQA